MKKILKPFINLIIILIVLLSCSQNYVLARVDAGGGGGGGSSSSSTIIDTNIYEPDSGDSTNRLEQKANIIVAVIRNVGIVVAVIALMVIGLKTMVGSAEEKSAYKQSLPGYILGVVMIVAISLIPTIIYNAVSSW